MVAVVLHKLGENGKRYRLATEKDLEVFRDAENYLEEKRERLREEWGIDPVLDEPTPEGKGRGAERAFSVRNYRLNTYGDLFNSRQKLALITFTEKVRLSYQKMIEEDYDKEYAKAVVSYLGLVINRVADFSTTLVRWFNHVENPCNTFARQALPMLWDYFELNLLQSIGQGTYESMLKQSLLTFSHLSQIPPVKFKEEEG